MMKNKSIMLFVVPLALFILAVISWQCIDAPLAPIAPSSDIQLSVPVADVTRLVSDFVGHNSKTLTLNSDGTFSYLYDQALPSRGIDSITMQPSSSSDQVAVGQFTVSALPTQNSTITLSQLGLPAIDYPGSPAPPFLATPVSVPGNTMDVSSQFDFVAVSNGTLSIQLTNNLPLQMNFSKPILLRNNQLSAPVDTSVIAIFYPSLIDSFKTYSGSVSLAGKTIRGQLKFDSLSFTTVSRTGPFSLKSTNGLSFQFSSSSIVADSASAVIPTQQIISESNTTFKLDDTVAVQSAQFRSGKIQLAVTNKLNINVGVYVQVNDFVSNASNQPYTIDTTLKGNDSLVVSIDMSKYNIAFTTFDPSSYGTSTKYSVGIKTINSVGAKSTVTKNDFIRAELRPQEHLVLQSITGKIKPQTININTAIKVDYSGLRDSQNKLTDTLSFSGVSVKLNLPITGGGFPISYQGLKLIAKNSKTNSVVSLDVPAISRGLYAGKYVIMPGDTSTVIEISGASFNTFLNNFTNYPNLPDSLFVQGPITLSPSGISTDSAYTIDDKAKVYPTVNVNFPSIFGMNAQYNDVVSFSAENDQQDFTNKVVNAKMNFYVTNRIPLGLKFKTSFLRWNTRFGKNDTVLVIAPADLISPADVAYDAPSSSYIVSGAKTSQIAIYLDTAQVRQFNSSDSVAVNFQLQTSGNGAKQVKIDQSNSIRLQASANMVFTVGKN
jgi:hypothetical protein